MRNNHPKSEGPAMKEHAALDKDMAARQKTTAAEKAAHAGHAGNAGFADHADHAGHAESSSTDAKPKSGLSK
jgi:hypothetical protein